MWSAAEPPALPGPAPASQRCLLRGQLSDRRTPRPQQGDEYKRCERKLREDDTRKASSMERKALCQLEQRASVERAQA